MAGLHWTMSNHGFVPAQIYLVKLLRSHMISFEEVAEEGKSPYVTEIQVGEIMHKYIQFGQNICLVHPCTKKQVNIQC